jgi:hypothetical protein
VILELFQNISLFGQCILQSIERLDGTFGLSKPLDGILVLVFIFSPLNQSEIINVIKMY